MYFDEFWIVFEGLRVGWERVGEVELGLIPRDWRRRTWSGVRFIVV
jgi:hypothetical protein